MSTVMLRRHPIHETLPGLWERLRALKRLQVSILEELSMAGGLLTQSELHGMLTRAKRYRDMPLPERAATLEEIRTTLLGLRARCATGNRSNGVWAPFFAPLTA